MPRRAATSCARSRMLMVDGNLADQLAHRRRRRQRARLRRRLLGLRVGAGRRRAGEHRAGRPQGARATRARWRASAPRTALDLPGGSYRGEHAFRGRAALSQKDCVERLAALHAWCAQRYPALKSTRSCCSDEHHTQARSRPATGSEVLNSIQRAVCYVTLTAEDDARRAGRDARARSRARAAWPTSTCRSTTLAPLLDRLHEHLQAKRQAVPARGGLHTVVMAPRPRRHPRARGDGPSVRGRPRARRRGHAATWSASASRASWSR